MHVMCRTPSIIMALSVMLGSALMKVHAQESPLSAELVHSYPMGWVVGLLAILFLIACVIILLLRAALKDQTRQMQESERRLNAILDSVDACIYIKDAKLLYTYGNRQLCARLDTNFAALISTRDSDYFPTSVSNRIRSTDLRVIALGQRVVCEEEIPSKDGTSVETFLSIKTPISNADGHITALCGVSTNITELHESRRAVHRLAYYDPLTDLPNRRMLQEKMEEALLIRKSLGQIAGILFIDLDKFKNINDERGHEVGDAVLRAVAARLLSVSDDEDTVARLGGDEFVILLHDLGTDVPEATNKALEVAESVRLALEQAVPVADEVYFTGGSIGVTLLDTASKSVSDALREADTAMYQSKELGRNRVALYAPAMHVHVAERARMLRDLVNAMEKKQFRLMVQPQHDKEQRIVGAELLLRWHHPEKGVIMPEKFIQLAEESGFIMELGEWVLAQACKTYVSLARAGCAHSISVNVSPVQLRHPDFNQRVSDILSQWKMPPEQLTLEVTENVLIDDIEDTARRMQGLAKLGLRFSIDDFGTGYSGLAYLHRLPLSEVKIPKCFVEKLPDEDAGTLIRLIVSTARLLKLRVVAEGVERATEAVFLLSCGCDALQGYYHQRPIPVEKWSANRLKSAQRRVQQHHDDEAQHQPAGRP